MSGDTKHARDMSPGEFKAAKSALARAGQPTYSPPKPRAIDTLSKAEYQRRLDAAKRGYLLSPIED